MSETQNSEQICKNFMYNNCKRDKCKFVHDKNICFHYWRNGSCRLESECKLSHLYVKQKNVTKNDLNENKKEKTKEETKEETKESKENKNDDRKSEKKKDRVRNRKRNTESFNPTQDPVDVRIWYDLGKISLSKEVTSRDIVLVPGLFSDFNKNEIYNKLVDEIESCGIPENELLKLWHGDTHLIADDHLRWKSKCPTFKMVIDRIKEYFNMDIKATRFNWYKNTEQWKPFHHDAAAVKKDKMDTQNFTVGVSFGVTREAAFEHAKTRTVISIPQPDSCIYAFANETNVIWRHGILQDIPNRDEGRISIIAWGWFDNVKQI